MAACDADGHVLQIGMNLHKPLVQAHGASFVLLHRQDIVVAKEHSAVAVVVTCLQHPY